MEKEGQMGKVSKVAAVEMRRTMQSGTSIRVVKGAV